jgi:hypothetical protein
LANVGTIWANVLLLADKDYEGGFSPDQINIAIPEAERELWSELSDMMQLSQGINNIDNRFYESTTINASIMDTFKVINTYQIAGNGKLTKPADLRYISSVRHTVYFPGSDPKEVRVYPITDGQLSARLNSSVVPPTKEYPVIAEYDTYYQFYPKNLGSVTLTYLRLPIPAVFGYTLVNGDYVYDPLTSTDSEFPDECINALSVKVANKLGIQLKDQALVNNIKAPTI